MVPIWDNTEDGDHVLHSIIEEDDHIDYTTIRKRRLYSVWRYREKMIVVI